LLLLAGAVVLLVTVFSDHSDDYGRVGFAQGSGAVTLPEGTVKLFFDEGSGGGAVLDRRLETPLTVKVVPAGTATPLPLEGTTPGAEGAVNERSFELGATGSLVELDVPASGDYGVTISGAPAGAITFGADRFTAVGRNWKLWGGLLAAGLLLAIIPVPRRRRTSVSEPSPA
jgi:hypothetical protein